MLQITSWISSKSGNISVGKIYTECLKLNLGLTDPLRYIWNHVSDTAKEQWNLNFAKLNSKFIELHHAIYYNTKVGIYSQCK